MRVRVVIYLIRKLNKYSKHYNNLLDQLINCIQMVNINLHQYKSFINGALIRQNLLYKCNKVNNKQFKIKSKIFNKSKQYKF